MFAGVLIPTISAPTRTSRSSRLHPIGSSSSARPTASRPTAGRSNYYVQESVGIATGILIAAIHHAGLASLTHMPSPIGFLGDILGRPSNERPFLILVVG